MSYYSEIKDLLINNEVYKKVKDFSKNRSDLETYFNVGKILNDAGKHYGEGIIKEYSKKLSEDLNKNYSITSLKYMRKFYRYTKSQPAADFLSWSHWIELLSIKEPEKIDYYVNQCHLLKLTRNELREKIKSKEYERLPDSAKEKLKKEEELDMKETIPNPIVIYNPENIEIMNEKMLHNLILENIADFMRELGTGYAFIESEYKIKIGNRYNYIDFLLYNIEFNCYVVVELKVTELKKEHIGQIHIYMNYIDDNLKKFNQNNTIGIIICKKNNKFVLEYSSDSRILVREYQVIERDT